MSHLRCLTFTQSFPLVSVSECERPAHHRRCSANCSRPLLTNCTSCPSPDLWTALKGKVQFACCFFTNTPGEQSFIPDSNCKALSWSLIHFSTSVVNWTDPVAPNANIFDIWWIYMWLYKYCHCCKCKFSLNVHCLSQSWEMIFNIHCMLCIMCCYKLPVFLIMFEKHHGSEATTGVSLIWIFPDCCEKTTQKSFSISCILFYGRRFVLKTKEACARTKFLKMNLETFLRWRPTSGNISVHTHLSC